MLDLKAMPTLRQNLKEFIKADPISIVLTRPTLTKTAAGGYIAGAPTFITRQQFRLVPFKRRLSGMQTATEIGNAALLDYVLVGYWNANIRRDDEFEYNGDNYRVVSIEPKSDDRTKTDRVVVQIEIHGGDKAPPT